MWYPNDPPLTKKDMQEMREMKNRAPVSLDHLCDYIVSTGNTEAYRWVSSPEVTEFCKRAVEESE